jgi:hypothetical protein
MQGIQPAEARGSNRILCTEFFARAQKKGGTCPPWQLHFPCYPKAQFMYARFRPRETEELPVFRAPGDRKDPRIPNGGFT